MAEFDKDKVVAVLNQILEMELAGVVRYTHYSFLVFGFGRIPIVAWLRDHYGATPTALNPRDRRLEARNAYMTFGLSRLTYSQRSLIEINSSSRSRIFVGKLLNDVKLAE